MSALQPLCLLLEINPYQLSKEELFLVESNIFINVCEELKEIIIEQNKDYFKNIAVNIEKENNMIDLKFIRIIINEILMTKEYTLTGIALYTDTPIDVVYDLVSGCNTNPTFLLTRKIIDLHRSVRPDLYVEIMNKIKQRMLIAS